MPLPPFPGRQLADPFALETLCWFPQTGGLNQQKRVFSRFRAGSPEVGGQGAGRVSSPEAVRVCPTQASLRSSASPGPPPSGLCLCPHVASPRVSVPRFPSYKDQSRRLEG